MKMMNKTKLVPTNLDPKQKFIESLTRREQRDVKKEVLCVEKCECGSYFTVGGMQMISAAISNRPNTCSKCSTK